MGIWSTSLYSGDFAKDLRATVAAVLRLPFPPDRLAEIVCETAPSAAHNPANEEYTTFWLVIADQFAKRGVVCDRVRATALSILDGGEDIAIHRRLGMKPSDLRKRARQLEEVRARLVSSRNAEHRSVLRTPQPLLMQVGDVMVYPTCRGKHINPYYASKELITYHSHGGPIPWTHDGWGAMVIVDAGRAFDFLSWYRPVTLALASALKHSMESLRGELLWRFELAGTCSPNQFRKMELENIGVLPIDPEKLRHVFPGIRPGTSAAVQDISIGNRMNAAPPGTTVIPNPGGVQRAFAPTIVDIQQILHE
jgi:hypothetical protein